MIGFDNTTMAQSEFVGLSTVDYPRQEMGERVLSLLQDRITDPDAAPREISLAPRLISVPSLRGRPRRPNQMV